MGAPWVPSLFFFVVLSMVAAHPGISKYRTEEWGSLRTQESR
jgi:hypothetical protein